VKLPERRSEQGIYLLIAVAALVVIYVVAFIVTNSKRVDVSFVAFDARAPLIVLMLICVLLGVLIGIVGARIAQRRGRAEAPQSTGTENGPTDAS
jgi:uncharacterized integral membrane protein